MDGTRRSLIAALLATAYSAALCGCKISLGEGAVIGSWECRRGIRVSCLDIRADHTYSQTITANGVKELSNTSVWTWEFKEGDGWAIDFEKFRHLADDGSSFSSSGGFWIVVPERRIPFGTPKLSVSPDVTIDYVKRETPCP